MNRREEARFRKFVVDHSAMVRGSLLKMTGDAQVTEDLHSQVFFKVWRASIASGEDYADKPKRWLFQIVTHTGIDHLRRSRHPSEPLEEGHGAHRDLPHLERQIDIREALLEAVDKLSSAKRMVFELMFFEECTVDEVAEQLNVSVNTVKSRQQRARTAVKKALEKRGLLPIGATLAVAALQGVSGVPS